MLNLAGGIRITWFSPEPFHPSVGDAVEKDDKAFDELGGRDVPARNGDPVPGPTELRKGTQEAGEGNKPVAPEDAALDEMRETDINVIPSTAAGVHDDTGQQLHETSKDEESLHCGESSGTDLPVPRPSVVQVGDSIVKGVIRMYGVVAGVKSAMNCGAV